LRNKNELYNATGVAELGASMKTVCYDVRDTERQLVLALTGE